MCYIETANLDGETNLKIRQAVPETATLTDKSKISSFRAVVECEPPNKNLYSFTGTLRIHGGK